MKTKEEILITNCPVFSALFHDRSNKASVMMKESILKSMTEFADQEKAALKDRITHEATVDSIIWEVLQIDRMSNQEFDSERERRHFQIRKVQEILKAI